MANTFQMLDTGGGMEKLSATTIKEAAKEMDERFAGWRRTESPYSLYEDDGLGSQRIWWNASSHGDWERYGPEF